MTARMITVEELQRESANRTIRCTNCQNWIRYTTGYAGTPDDRVTEKLPGQPAKDRRYVVCPGCNHERVIALGHIT